MKVPCSLVKESLSFSNLVFSNLCSSYLWRICVSPKTTGKKAERNSIKHSFEGSKLLSCLFLFALVGLGRSGRSGAKGEVFVVGVVLWLSLPSASRAFS